MAATSTEAPPPHRLLMPGTRFTQNGKERVVRNDGYPVKFVPDEAGSSSGYFLRGWRDGGTRPRVPVVITHEVPACGVCRGTAILYGASGTSIATCEYCDGTGVRPHEHES